MLKYTVSLYTSIPFGLKALYRNIIIPQNENERERNTDILLIKHLNGHLPNAHNTIPAAHKTSIGIFKKKGRGGKSAIRLCTPPRSDASNIFLNEVLIQRSELTQSMLTVRNSVRSALSTLQMQVSSHLTVQSSSMLRKSGTHLTRSNLLKGFTLNICA